HRLNEMNISTIHSFCNVLLHEQGLMTKLPIDLEMLQDDEEKQEKKELFDAFLKEKLTKDDWDKLESVKGKSGNRRKIRGDMETLYMQMADLPEDTTIVIPKPVDETKSKEALSVLESIIYGDPGKGIPSLEKRLLDALNSCVTADKRSEPDFKEAVSYADACEKYCLKGKAPFKDIREFLEAPHETKAENKLYNSLLSKTDYSFISETGSNYKTLNKLPIIDQDEVSRANQRISSEINALLTEEVRSVFQIIKPDKCEDEDKNVISFAEAADAQNTRNNYGIAVATYAKQARDYYRQNAPKNKITNDRLLELTRDLVLNENKSALEYFSKKYTRFFVDEFQDTDRIQESFIYRLASEVDDEKKLRDGALFVVGDPKQSIYRFRGAQPAVYFHTKEKMEGLKNAKVYELSYNYRSNKDVIGSDDVIGWVNTKFAEADSVTPIVDEDGVSYSYKPMTAKKDALSDDNVIHGIYHIGHPDAEQKIEVTRQMKRENKTCDAYFYNEIEQGADIKNVVNLILNLTKKDEHGNGYFKITRYDADHKPYADDIRRSDFLLISQNKPMMDKYVAAMKKNGIAVVLDGEEDMKTDKALVVFVMLYQYLVNPRDPFYRTGAEEALRETLNIKSEKKLNELSHSILDCLYEDAKSMTAYGMAEYLEKQVSALFDKDESVSRVEALSSQAHIRQMIESLCVDVTGTGIEMAEAMQNYLNTKCEHELSLDENSDAVRFMNLHKTKGLEGEIVIFLDRRGKNDRSPAKCMDGDRFYPGEKFWTSLNGYPQTKEKADRSEKAELHRLEYVAATRAGQAVVFMDVISHNGLFARKKLTSAIKKAELDADHQDRTYYMKAGDTTYSYRISESDDISEKIARILPADKLENKPYEAENPKSYASSNDDYPEAKKQELKTAGMVVKESPSNMEKGSYHKKTAERFDEYNWDMLRPIGNVAGDILHRSMELL
ncbi:MAG: UvrD-helicase domain-containing protein, partial [Lachnospiraceae bacterium]|nr:UvrD-helicase domain-containing protein [Lachnospiraceae bacterium]